MAVVDRSGITAQQFSDYVNILTAGFRAALGSDLSLDAENAQSELIAILAEADADIDSALTQVANGANLSTAAGAFLDDLVSQFGFTRQPASRSVVTAQLTGAAGTVVPSGSQARTTSGDMFASTAEATIPASAVFRAVEDGAVAVGANTLTEIVTPVLGWDGIANTAAGVPGRLVETDTELRDRYSAQLASNATSTAESLRARILGLDGVSGCIILENDTNAALTSGANRGVAIAAKSIAAVVEGGASQDIVNALGAAKPLGIATSGSSSGVYAGTAIRYEPVATIAVKVVMSINTNADRFPGDGVARIRQSIIDLFAGASEFRTAGPVSIGDSVDSNRVIGAITRTPGFTITSGPTLTDTNDAALPSPVPYNRRLVIDAAATDANITISLT